MTLYCGVDLHSNNHVVLLLDSADKVVEKRRLDNTLPLILDFLEPYRDDVQGVAIESTPNWYWIYDGLRDHGYDARLVDVLKVKQYDGLKHTNDVDDAFHLAHLMRLGILPTVNVLPRSVRRLRDLMRRRLQLVRISTSCANMRNNLLARETGWHGRTRDAELPDWGDAARTLNWDVTVEVAETVRAQIHRIEKLIRKELKEDPCYVILRTIPGVGLILAATIATETGPISRFAGPGNYASYARLVDASRWSNGKKKSLNNRKAGNRYLSWAFHEAAHHACRYQPKAHAFLQRKRAKSHPMVAIRALARKLARAAFYMMRDQMPYDEDRLFH